MAETTIPSNAPEADPSGQRGPSPVLVPIRAPEAVMLAALPVAVVVALSALQFTGAFTTGTLLSDPGVIVTRGLPVARVVHDAAASVTIGLLIAATFLLPGQRILPGVVSFSQSKAIRWAAWAASVWLAAGIAVLVFTAANSIGVPVTR